MIDDATEPDDADGDEVPDACDECEGDDRVDTDADGVPDDCDECSEGDDAQDEDGDGVPDACEEFGGSGLYVEGEGVLKVQECGCDSTGAPAGAAWLVVGGLVIGLRRRRQV